MMHLLFLFAAPLACPVLNTATVGGALGDGDLRVTVTHSEKNPTLTCQFTQAEYELTIEISRLASPDQFARFADHTCHGGREVTPLKAIGNEAIACSLGRGGQIVEKAAGRVRNQAFVIRLSTTENAADAKSIRSKTTALAEQVAGYLF